ncbi:hypothetical protein Thi970DRAFT_04591 [Thiorhodovibrio frisius]|uniref:Uncharacterized protein n=1 Tax=Thiorhodovibrio frisius TaxID=631362 RepID=H8Z7I6_9GAMM|nr:hypothetical protein Thi970DRAFT_04591 [Thiorhodovibrio frisius]WPL21975.1 hypothetical protein Thiofri_02117 [Thiorhodovibrio frisius]
MAKARKLATACRIEVDFHQADLRDWSPGTSAGTWEQAQPPGIDEQAAQLRDIAIDSRARERLPGLGAALPANRTQPTAFSQLHQRSINSVGG